MAGASATYTLKAKDQTKTAFKSVRASLAKVSGSVLNLKSAIGALVGVGGFGVMIAQSLKAGDSLAKTADKIGIATERLAGLRHAADLTGVSQQTLDMALQRMTRRLSEAAQGTGEARKALQELGLSAQQLAQLSPDRQMYAIADAMQQVGNQGDRVRLAMRLFDSEGVALVNTLADGSEGLKRAQEAIEGYGGALSRVDAAKIEAANDALSRAKAMISGVFMQISVQLAPWIAELGERFAALSAKTGGFKSQIESAMQGVLTFAARAGDAINYLQIGWLNFKLILNSVGVALFKTINLVLEGYTNLRKLLDEDYEPPAFFSNMQGAMQGVVKEGENIRAEIELLKAVEPYSEKLIGFFADVQARAQEAGEAVAASRSRMIMPEDEIGKIEIASENMMNLEAMIADHLKRIADIEMQEQARSIALWQSGWRGKIQITSGILKNISALMQTENKKQFEIGKAAAKAQIAIDTYAMATASYKALAGIPIVGPALGVAAAVAAIAYGKAQMDAVNSQSMGGGSIGGGSVSAGGSLPAGAVATASPDAFAADQQTAARPRQDVNITLVGQRYTANDVRDLMEAMQEQIGDDVNLNVRLDA